MRTKKLTQAELARHLGVSRTHITLLIQGKRKLSDKLADKLADTLADLRAGLLVGLKADYLNAHTVASNPLGGIKHVSGGFDPHALPPVFLKSYFNNYFT
jgi:transcriptional regulator with XRE-family HTH domain